MEFSDKVKDVSKKVGDVAEKTYKTVADKSNQLIQNTKLKIKISDIEQEIEIMYSDFGKRIYEKFKAGEEVDGFEKECKKITKMYKEIEELDAKSLNLRGLRKCSNCMQAIEVEAKYCPSCGEKQKKIKEEKEEKVPVSKVCVVCGTEHPVDVNFCTKCGNKF
ncbi:MAG: zinc ribbon domain-containing protein [Clostridia bacterium]|nr:zinc ribbon domain-containing protein [Clostridia bacterium]